MCLGTLVCTHAHWHSRWSVHPKSPHAARGNLEQSAELRDLEHRLDAAVRKVCPPSMSAHVDDIVQQAMMRVVRIRDRSEGSEPLGASYLWKVAYTTTIDQLRRMQSQAQLRDNLAHVGGSPSGPALSPEDAAAGQEIGVAIRECLGDLLDARRRAVVLHLQGHSVPEAGELLGWTRKRAENQVYRGLADLRRCLRNKGFER